MHPELEAILQVQRDDEALREVEAELTRLAPRLATLDRARQRVREESARAESTLARETERYRALEERIVEHRQRHEKNLATLNQAHKLREATAAMAQVETARRVLADEESELLALGRRLTDLRSAVAAAKDAVETLELEQVDSRAAVEADRAALGERIGAARAQRAASAAKVGPSLLARYDRMNTRRKAQSVFAMRNYSCGSCDMAISMQRRPALASGQSIETCEACGVLLYVDVSVAATTGGN